MLNRSASLVMSPSVLKALPGKLDIKKHSPSILYLSTGLTEIQNFTFTSFLHIHRGIESCKETDRENNKHSFDIASSGISPKTFSLSVNTLEVLCSISTFFIGNTHLYTCCLFYQWQHLRCCVYCQQSVIG